MSPHYRCITLQELWKGNALATSPLSLGVVEDTPYKWVCRLRFTKENFPAAGLGGERVFYSKRAPQRMTKVALQHSCPRSDRMLSGG